MIQELFPRDYPDTIIRCPLKKLTAYNDIFINRILFHESS